MHARSPLWKTITTSPHPWEQEALDFLRAALPDHEPYRVWANFELTADDGSINEIDALVLTPLGLFLVEIKSHRGSVAGDAGTWTFHFDGRESTRDAPRLFANRKAKRLKTRLDRTRVGRKHHLPFVEAVVFLSATDLETRWLDATARQGVFVRRTDGDTPSPIPGLRPLFSWTVRPGAKLGAATTRWLDGALEEIGIRPSQSQRQVGDYQLEELLEDGAGAHDAWGG